MIKYFAISIVFVCLCYLGFCLKNIYKKKVEFLSELLNFMFVLQSEIKNNKTSIIDIISCTSYKGEFNLFVQNIKSKISKNIRIDNKDYPKIFLKKNEINSISDFFNSIGYQDYDSTLTNISRYIIIFDNYVKQAKGELTKKGELYYKLFILFALAVVLIMV